MRNFVVIILLLLIQKPIHCQTRVTIAQTKQLTDYLDISATQEELTRVTDLQNAVESKEKSESERIESFHALMFWYAKHLNMDTTGLKKIIQSRGSRQTVKYNLSVFEDIQYPSNPKGRLGEVKKFGNGKVPVILIPEYRKNWKIFKDLVQLNQNEFTYYVITLPGYNGTNPYELPKHYDFSNREWLDNVVTGIITLIKEENLKKPVIVGALNAGSYIATNVISRLPGKTRGMILLNGAIREGSEPETFELPIAKRSAEVNTSFTSVMWYLLSRRKFSEQELELMAKRSLPPNQLIFYYTKDTVKVKEVYKMHNSFRSLMERYDLEWNTADLSDQLKEIKEPALIVLSNYDSEWPFGSKTNHLIDQWKNFKTTNNLTNFQITEIENTRLVLSIDKPTDIANLLKSFMLEKSIQRK